MEQSIVLYPYHFNYQAVGCPSHSTILFLHGFMGDCHDFDAAIALLADQFHCLIVDLPGHGKTQVLADDSHYTMTNTAHGLIQFLEALSIPTCALVGYSMGGRLALYLTLHFPRYFCKTVLESASPGLKTPVERTQRMLKDFQLAGTLETDFPAFLARWYQQPLFRSLQSDPDFQQLFHQRLQNDPTLLAKSLRNLSTGCQPSLWQQLERNTVPIELLVGEFDPKFVEINSEMAQLGKLTQMIQIPRCGHNIHFENPQAFAHHLTAFFATSQSKMK